MALLSKAIAFIGFIVAIFAAFGCGTRAEHGSMQDLTPQQRTQKQIDAIQNNPNMPPAAKEAALATLNAHSSVSSEAPGKKKR